MKKGSTYVQYKGNLYSEYFLALAYRYKTLGLITDDTKFGNFYFL